MGEVLLDAEIRTHLAYFFLHDSDDRGGVLPEDDDDRLVLETTDGVCILLGDLERTDEVPVRARVVRGPEADAPGEVVFDKTMFLYGAGLVLHDGFPATRHELDLGGPGRVGVRISLDRDTAPPLVTVVLGELEPDRSVLPPEPLTRRVGKWLRGGR